jgi:serine/threonine-protein kinase
MTRRDAGPNEHDAATAAADSFPLDLGTVSVTDPSGAVHPAVQRDLERPVHVRLVGADASTQASEDLVREARVMGALEHPNIVPVHALTSDRRGRPMLVMKRVEGERWSELCAAAERSGAAALDATLERHAEILMDVCKAIHFAHGRGFVHCDLAPEHVWVGVHGEVLVAGWGNAVGIRPETELVAPPLRPLRCAPGSTPPELVIGDGSRADERTDVYLLGALLHRVVTGRPRHEGATLAETLANAQRSDPVAYDKEVAAELGAVCNRATSRDPGARFATAEELRFALGAYLQHRGSRALAAEALERMEALRHAIATGADGAVVHRLTVEGRFGFEQALRAWPGNHEAAAGLERLLRLAFEHALERGHHDEAEALLAELGERAADLGARLGAKRQERARRGRRLIELERLWDDHDLERRARDRMRFALVLASALTLVVGALVVLRWVGWHTAGYPDALVVLAIMGATGHWAGLRRLAAENAMSRRLTRVFQGALLMLGGWFVAAWGLGVDFTVALGVSMLVFGAAAGAVATTVTHWYALGAAAYFLGALAIFAWPRFRGVAFLLGHIGGVLSIALQARRSRRRAR